MIPPSEVTSISLVGRGTEQEWIISVVIFHALICTSFMSLMTSSNYFLNQQIHILPITPSSRRETKGSFRLDLKQKSITTTNTK